jgi:hypothetical protein
VSVAAFPLSWPAHFPRAKSRERGAFKTTLHGALTNVEGSLRKFAADSGKRCSKSVRSEDGSKRRFMMDQQRRSTPPTKCAPTPSKPAR